MNIKFINNEFGKRSKYVKFDDFLKTMAEQYKQRSKAWYLMPIFLGIIGSLITHFALRHDDPKMARNCWIIGIALLGIGIASMIAGSFATLESMTDMVTP